MLNMLVVVGVISGLIVLGAVASLLLGILEAAVKVAFSLGGLWIVGIGAAGVVSIIQCVAGTQAWDVTVATEGLWMSWINVCLRVFQLICS